MSETLMRQSRTYRASTSRPCRTYAAARGPLERQTRRATEARRSGRATMGDRLESTTLALYCSFCGRAIRSTSVVSILFEYTSLGYSWGGCWGGGGGGRCWPVRVWVGSHSSRTSGDVQFRKPRTHLGGPLDRSHRHGRARYRHERQNASPSASIRLRNGGIASLFASRARRRSSMPSSIATLRLNSGHLRQALRSTAIEIASPAGALLWPSRFRTVGHVVSKRPAIRVSRDTLRDFP